ncbi:HNH endonuclease [Candidatus Bipolaricaulota bacterium]|nr:HNH endonuclease [Candidatus Bipolaricaulota bacterium]
MSIADMVATLLEGLQQVGESTDWRGQQNWVKLGSETHCWRCGGEFGKDIESGSHAWHHIIPTSEGGPDTADNRSLLCGNCHNVVHRYYLPTSKIGKKRTRDGSWRRVAKFEEGIEISQSIPAADGSLSSCRDCETQGVIDGVSEGYWDGQGMMVFMKCPKCGLGFAVPFIGTNNAPEVDLNAVFFAQMESSFANSTEDLPPALADRVQSFGNTLATMLRDFTKELTSATKKAQELGLTDQETESQAAPIRKKYVEMIKSILPEAANLEEACKAHKH